MPISESYADLDASRAASEKTANFRQDVAARAGGMLDRGRVAAMLGVEPAALERQHQERQILGVPYGNETRYPAAQFVDGSTVSDLNLVLEALRDMDPWE